MSGDTDQNKRDAVAFYELAFNQRQPEEAVRQYMGATYTQHNPEVEDGPKGFIEFVHGFTTRFPLVQLTIKHIIAEDDLVVLHVHAKMSPDDRGAALFDMFRFDRGKVVEHWDAIQRIPENSANNNGMF